MHDDVKAKLEAVQNVGDILFSRLKDLRDIGNEKPSQLAISYSAKAYESLDLMLMYTERLATIMDSDLEKAGVVDEAIAKSKEGLQLL